MFKFMLSSPESVVSVEDLSPIAEEPASTLSWILSSPNPELMKECSAATASPWVLMRERSKA